MVVLLLLLTNPEVFRSNAHYLRWLLVPLMCNLPMVVGVCRIHATTPPSINTEPRKLSWECLPTLHDFTFTHLKKSLVIALYNYL